MKESGKIEGGDGEETMSDVPRRVLWAWLFCESELNCVDIGRQMNVV